MTGIDRLRVLQFVVVFDLRFGLAGKTLFAVALARDVVFGRTAVVAAGADFSSCQWIGRHSVSPHLNEDKTRRRKVLFRSFPRPAYAQDCGGSAAQSAVARGAKAESGNPEL